MSCVWMSLPDRIASIIDWVRIGGHWFWNMDGILEIDQWRCFLTKKHQLRSATFWTKIPPLKAKFCATITKDRKTFPSACRIFTLSMDLPHSSRCNCPSSSAPARSTSHRCRSPRHLQSLSNRPRPVCDSSASIILFLPECIAVYFEVVGLLECGQVDSIAMNDLRESERNDRACVTRWVLPADPTLTHFDWESPHCYALLDRNSMMLCHYQIASYLILNQFFLQIWWRLQTNDFK